ncbi:hypothetical protein Psuf_064280 [Phytohabitans suffuscus]|uniref:tRNA-binding domain-containing protein n=1 Tax=Phytohabitans suffuscus TaxID=624315 RepID=A0A6F8YSG1_9ACTN|nr:hypothetical protein Psuf_064280 [Phytohabitans suffuscus]
MRIPLSWLREYVDLPAGADVGDALVRLGIEVDAVVDQRATVRGDLVVGRVAEIEELTGFKKPIRFCRVDIGRERPQEIVCGASNFAPGDLVAVILPGGVLPGGFEIGARKTYGRMSAGMIVSAREIGVSDEHAGIIVLPPSSGARPGEDARPYVGLDDVIFELEITPTADTRCRCGASPASCRTPSTPRSATQAALESWRRGRRRRRRTRWSLKILWVATASRRGPCAASTRPRRRRSSCAAG